MPRPAPHPKYLQCRSFDHVYELKNKKKESRFEVFDRENQSVFREVVSAPTKESTLAQQTLWNSRRSLVDFAKHLENMPKIFLEEVQPLSPEFVQEHFKDGMQPILDKIIKEQKAIILLDEHPDLEKFTCPITFEPFEDPVIDEHGHTFEKSAIEEHLKNNTNCPISREPIKNLSPNRLVKDQVEELRAQDPIPTLGNCKQENLNLATKTIEMARTYAEEGELEEAIASFKKALNYTNRTEDYRELSEIYKQIGEPEKAELAELYLVKYQIEKEQFNQAIVVLEKMPNRTADLTDLLALLFLFPNSERTFEDSQDKAVKVLIEQAQSGEELPEKVAELYRVATRINPHMLKLYSRFSELVDLPEKKRHVLLKGALHALEKRKTAKALELSERAEKFGQITWRDYHPFFIAGVFDDAEERLEKLGKKFLQSEQYDDMLKALKYLYELNPTREHARSVLEAYSLQEKKDKELKWYHTYIEYYFEDGEEEKAQLVIEKALESFPEDIELLEWLGNIYEESKHEKLEEIWNRLAVAYLQNNQLIEAEKTYRKGFAHFHDIEVGFRLGEVQLEVGKTFESIKTFTQIAEEALLNENTEALKESIVRIRAIDPRMEHLDKEERLHLVAQSQIVQLTDRVRKLEDLLGVKEVEKGPAPIIPESAFGAADWNTYFGDVGVEPPLPPDIYEILESPCPFWPDQKVEDTHMLCLIPKTVNGIPLTLDSLEDLVKHPKQGAPTKYKGYNDKVKTEHGRTGIERSYWALMTTEVIPNSCLKPYVEQKNQVERFPSYKLPPVLGAAVVILMHTYKPGRPIYTDEKLGPRYTWTRCQEKVDSNIMPTAIGGLSTEGPLLFYDECFRNVGCGAAGFRKFH